MTLTPVDLRPRQAIDDLLDGVVLVADGFNTVRLRPEEAALYERCADDRVTKAIDDTRVSPVVETLNGFGCSELDVAANQAHAGLRAPGSDAKCRECAPAEADSFDLAVKEVVDSPTLIVTSPVVSGRRKASLEGDALDDPPPAPRWAFALILALAIASRAPVSREDRAVMVLPVPSDNFIPRSMQAVADDVGSPPGGVEHADAGADAPMFKQSWTPVMVSRAGRHNHPRTSHAPVKQSRHVHVHVTGSERLRALWYRVDAEHNAAVVEQLLGGSGPLSWRTQRWIDRWVRWPISSGLSCRGPRNL